MNLPLTPSFRLDGKRALVCGASRGIGLASAAALAQAGAEVVCMSRDRPALEALVHDLRASGGTASAIAGDVCDISWTRHAIEGHGPLDIFVNSAGAARHTLFTDVEPEDFDAVAGVNIRATFFVAQAAARNMRQHARKGSIITISSQMGHVGGPERSVYAATKHATEGMTKSAAIELGRDGIRINTICPTFVRTALSEKTLSDPERRAWVDARIKLGRLAEVEDIMGAVVFLASDAAAMITGTSILVDGGWTAE
ncbi:SDR family NAD(P)-dependent oxidoreductase [Rhizobium sp. SYY.PMSO]|uniref:SDR family NAD(P)-dependent oxidoreductase n=1 Tax=Rhizobium sp. SYY.PMSO TaxID=3382192 RepID=UPI00398FF39B